MDDLTYESFQAFCRALKRKGPGFSFGREEAWEKGVLAAASKAREVYRFGRPFEKADREAFYQKKACQYQGKYKETYLEALKRCLEHLGRREPR